MADPAYWVDRDCARCGRATDHHDDLQDLRADRSAGAETSAPTSARECRDAHMNPSEHGVRCSDCGATGCEALFHACLVADYSDPAFGAVHHLVVPTYGLQHSWYHAETQPAVAAFVLHHLDRAPNEHDRQRIRTATDGSTRVRARHPGTQNADWDHHIGNVDLRRPDIYTATVRSWAESVATTLLGNEPMATGDGTSSR